MHLLLIYMMRFKHWVKPQHVSLYKKLAVDCFRKSGEYFNLKCPLTGEVREGKNWMETH